MYLDNSSINKLMLSFDVRERKKGKQLCNLKQSEFNIANYLGHEPMNGEVNFTNKKPNDLIKRIQFTVHITGITHE